jgi:ABC-2 type transport system ATP-binding protein
MAEAKGAENLKDQCESNSHDAISTDNLTKIFQVQGTELQAITQLNMQIGKGEVFGLLGPNGAGKTTTMRLLLSLIKPTSGTAKICGYDITENGQEIRKVTGYLPEEMGLYNYLSPQEYLQIIAKLCDVPKGMIHQRTSELIDLFKLDKVANRKIGELSRGFRRRVAIASTLVHDPEVLLLDEPTSGLDPLSAIQLQDLILELAGKGKTVLLCSHDLSEVSRICSKIGILFKGTLVYSCDMHDIISKTPVRLMNITLSEPVPKIEKSLKSISEIEQLTVVNNEISVRIREPTIAIPQIINVIAQQGGKILEIKEKESALEQIYRKYVEG